MADVGYMSFGVIQFELCVLFSITTPKMLLPWIRMDLKVFAAHW